MKEVQVVHILEDVVQFVKCVHLICMHRQSYPHLLTPPYNTPPYIDGMLCMNWFPAPLIINNAAHANPNMMGTPINLPPHQMEVPYCITVHCHHGGLCFAPP